LDEIKIKKAISNAEEKDTLYIDKYSGEKRILPNLARVFIIHFPKPIEIENLIYKLVNHQEVEYAHGPVQLVNCAVYPNDQYYVNGEQWYLDRIDAPNAWGITKGDPNIKIALIDIEGVELTHSDLSSKIAGGDNNPGGVTKVHGTSVAGFAGAATNNGNLGIASLGWNIKLLTFQPYNDNEFRNILAQKIKDAADSGVTVINLSFRTIKKDFTSCSKGLTKNNNSSR
jgi:thermitase